MRARYGVVALMPGIVEIPSLTCVLSLLINIPELRQNQPSAGSIGLILTKFCRGMACLQGCHFVLSDLVQCSMWHVTSMSVPMSVAQGHCPTSCCVHVCTSEITGRTWEVQRLNEIFLLMGLWNQTYKFHISDLIGDNWKLSCDK